MGQRAGWRADHDGEDWYVLWFPVRYDARSGENDESLSVYLPKGKELRARAAQVIADALNRAGIPRPRKRPYDTKRDGSDHVA